MFKEILLAGTGGFIGSALRYAVSVVLVSASVKSGFPFGTLLVNCIGALVIGVLWILLPPGSWQALAMAGFCGGFTTFSAFSLETLGMIRSGETINALLYIAASVLLCLLFVWIGTLLGSRVAR